jgi:hypothetical protein
VTNAVAANTPIAFCMTVFPALNCRTKPTLHPTASCAAWM